MIQSIGIKPTVKWRKGDELKFSEAQHNGFEIHSSEKNTGEIEDKLNTLMDLLMPHKDQLLNLAKKAEAEIWACYYGFKDEMWGLYFLK